MSNNKQLEVDEDGYYKEDKVVIIGSDVYTTETKWDDYNYYNTYKKNDVFHSTDDCAVFESLSDGNEIYGAWYYNGILHNTNGHALVYKDYILNKFSFKYYLFGVEYSKEEYDKKLVQMKDEMEEALKQSDLNKEAVSIINKFI